MIYHPIISENSKMVEERRKLEKQLMEEQINELKKENTQLKQRSNRGTAETM